MGWAIDALNREQVSRILVFDPAGHLYSGNTLMLREEVHEFGVLIKIGFHAVIPLPPGRAPGMGELEVYAVTDDGRYFPLQLSP